LTRELFLEYIKKKSVPRQRRRLLENSPGGLGTEVKGMEVVPLLDRLKRFLQDFFAGITYFEIEQTARKEKLSRQNLFLLINFGDLLGIPLLPPYYALRIFPHVLPVIDSWKKGMLRERDLTEVGSL